MARDEAENVDVRAVEMTPIERMRHSAAHVMAEAVTEMFPDARLGIGPPIENGFYYDFDLPRTLTPDDLEQVEKLMSDSIAADKPFECRPVTKEEAEALFRDQPYKLELIEQFGDGDLTVYQHGDFVDLCRGPHVESTGKLGPFKLTNVSGAYWRGSEQNPMLQRIYGTMWPTSRELEEHLERLRLARERDHRRLGRELQLFTFSPDIGPGIPLFLPKGEILRHQMEEYIRQTQTRYGYQHVWTAHLVKKELFEKSGHVEHYADVMFPPMVDEDDQYMLKPMNCPSHMVLFNSQYHSYRDLPLRYCEFATLYRYEKSGELSGLSRVRALTQDDCHVFCTPDQIQEEFGRCIRLIREVLDTYGFSDYAVQLSLRDAADTGKFVADDAKWKAAESALREALDSLGVDYAPVAGEAAFYGPKADFMARDVLGREWQLSTIQIDFIQPERLGCKYIGEDGEPHTPVVIHRAVTGTTERFLGVLIEHFGGAFPTWLAPVQVVVLPIADRHVSYAASVAERLGKREVRTQVDDRVERLNAKIRDAQLQKVPYMLIVGDKEAESGEAAVRLRTGQDLGKKPVDEVLSLVLDDIGSKRLEPAAPA
ncbi:MAG TPA: threonine--tRNA ligase [Chloroflexota bacterium]|nr:threonine--tRNA ligase [Chloroflexota bacterium]